MSSPRILSLGQCAADHGSLSRLFRTQFATELDDANTFTEAFERLRQERYDLVLVNRILDYEGTSGVDFIAQLKADPQLKDVRAMLVSNHADAQEQAVSQGALPGFGKSALGRPETIAQIRAALDGGV